MEIAFADQPSLQFAANTRAVDIQGRMRILSLTYLSQYSAPTSAEYLQLEREFCQTVSNSPAVPNLAEA